MAFLVFVGAAVGLRYWPAAAVNAAPTADAGGSSSILQRVGGGRRTSWWSTWAGQRLLLGVTPASVQHPPCSTGPEAR